MIKLKQGISLHILPTSKFKTISVQFRFTAPLQVDQITKRTLLANIMDINSKQYPTQKDFRTKLSELYGASFFTDVLRYGNYHVLSFNIDFIDGKIIHETDIFEEVMLFMRRVLLQPNVSKGEFHKTTFKREVNKLKDDYLSRYDDKSVYADDKLNELYFDLPEHQMISYGQLEDLNDINASDVYKTYQKMIGEDQIDIFIVGNIQEKDVLKTLESFDLTARAPKRSAPFYKKDKPSMLKQKIEKQEINQSLMIMGFETPVYYHEDHYYTGLVFNGLFGGMTHSKLFQIVREKENIAYAISSDIDSYRGLLTVDVGIDYKDIEETKTIILQQLSEIQNGGITDSELFQTKELLKSELYQIGDSPHTMIESRFSVFLIEKEELSISEWIDRIDSVGKKDVAQLAGMLRLEAIFELIGESN